MIHYDVICAGEMLIDFTPGTEHYSYTANPGGAPANVAVSTARNGLTTAFLGILGNDDFGKRLKRTLLENKISMLCPTLTDQAITTLAFVTLYENGERSFTFSRKPGADILLSIDDVKQEDILACRLFHAGSFSLSNQPSCDAIKYAMKLAHEAGKLVSFDVNYRDMVWHDPARCKKEIESILPYVDFLKISDEELFFVGGEEHIHSFMEQYHISVLIQTLGAAGATYYFHGNQKTIPAQQVSAIDATGAGDAFWGAFLSRMLLFSIHSVNDITEKMVEEALNYGNISGALCVQKMGGIPAIPSAEEIQKSLNS